MSRPRFTLRALGARLTYANVMATAAVFLALGGGAYAAVALPPNSVGRTQLRDAAVGRSELAARTVTRSKLGTRAVGWRTLGRGAVSTSKLSPAVRAQLGRPGPAGPKGDTGPRGPAGADALGARPIRFDVAATDAPAPATVLDISGLQLKATCTLTGATAAINLVAVAPEASILQATFAVDQGADPTNPAAPDTGSAQFTLAANAETTLSGPGVDSGYARVNARAIVTAPSRIVSLDLVELVDGDSDRCSISGTAVAAS